MNEQPLGARPRKIRATDINHIRWLLKQGHTQRQVAAAFGVSQGTIMQINRKWTWWWVDENQEGVPKDERN